MTISIYATSTMSRLVANPSPQWAAFHAKVGDLHLNRSDFLKAYHSERFDHLHGRILGMAEDPNPSIEALVNKGFTELETKTTVKPWRHTRKVLDMLHSSEQLDLDVYHLSEGTGPINDISMVLLYVAKDQENIELDNRGRYPRLLLNTKHIGLLHPSTRVAALRHVGSISAPRGCLKKMVYGN